jgi:hypothetical protein
VTFTTWEALYKSDLQGAVAVTIAPVLFLVYLAFRDRPIAGGVVPAAARFVHLWAVAFAVLTIADPLAGGPLLRALGVADRPIATVVMVFFVLLGDFRVYLLLFTLMTYAGTRHDARVADPVTAARDALRLFSPRATALAALATLVVPIAAVTVEAILRARLGATPAQAIWLAYELAFLTVAIVLRTWIVPARVPASEPRLRNYLRALLLYVAAYYALWAAADVLILGGLDVGWALRVVPNQLYYALFVPFAWWAFFARRYADSSTSTQASR